MEYMEYLVAMRDTMSVVISLTTVYFGVIDQESFCIPAKIVLSPLAFIAVLLVLEHLDTIIILIVFIGIIAGGIVWLVDTLQTIRSRHRYRRQVTK